MYLKIKLTDEKKINKLSEDEWVSSNVSFEAYDNQDCQLYRTTGIMQDDLGQLHNCTFLIKRHGVNHEVYTFYFFSNHGVVSLIQLGRKNHIKVKCHKENMESEGFMDFGKREIPSSIRVEDAKLIKVFKEHGVRELTFKTSDYVTKEGGKTFFAKVHW